MLNELNWADSFEFVSEIGDSAGAENVVEALNLSSEEMAAVVEQRTTGGAWVPETGRTSLDANRSDARDTYAHRELDGAVAVPKVGRVSDRQVTRFKAERAFAGVVTWRSGEICEAQVEDNKGQRFEYEFKVSDLPVAQRERVQVGSLVNVLTGRYLFGTTEAFGVKIYLALESKSSRLRTAMMAHVVDQWSFLDSEPEGLSERSPY